jgi:hypothetical protein
MSAAIRITDWKPVPKGALLGFAKIEMPSGMILIDCTILTGANGPWASPPGKPMVGSDGTVVKDADNRIIYTGVVDFVSREKRNQWSQAVVAALQATQPEAFAP